MNAEQFIKTKTDEMVEKFRSQLATQNIQLNGEQEWILRVGISYGLSISSLLLSSFPVDVTFCEAEKAQ